MLFRNRILIFGGTGSLGQRMIARWSRDNDLTIVSRDENKHWTLKQKLTREQSVKFVIGDVRDLGRVTQIVNEAAPNYVIMAAALKQVDTCELTPEESVKTNLIGTQNVIDAVDAYVGKSISKMLFVSTDKACMPTTTYGMCKAVSERLVLNRPCSKHCEFVCTRYGNVLESRGSIVPLFKWQVANKDRLTVTDLDMTRFLMTLDESVTLIEDALECGHHGETWVPRLPAMRIGDLASIFSRRYDKQIEVIGLRQSEKLHEDLISETESLRVREVPVPCNVASCGQNMRWVVSSSLTRPFRDTRFSYSSSLDVLSEHDLEAKLKRLGVFDMSIDQFPGHKIEEIRTT